MTKKFVIEKLLLIKSTLVHLKNDKSFNNSDLDDAYLYAAESTVDILAKQLGVSEDLKKNGVK